MESVKSPAALEESLCVLSDILLDALDIVTEAKEYFKHKDPSADPSGYAYIIRPDKAPEKVPLRIIRMIKDHTEEVQSNASNDTDTPQ